MLKTLRISLMFLIFNLVLTQTAFAITIEEGKQAFQNYVRLSNNCSISLINMYDKNTQIKRIVKNPNGTTYTKIMPVGMYKTMIIGYSKAALLQGYNNIYTNVSFSKCGDAVVVNALRHPSTSKDKLPAKISFHKNSTGRIVIKEEIFHTNAASLVK